MTSRGLSAATAVADWGISALPGRGEVGVGRPGADGGVITVCTGFLSMEREWFQGQPLMFGHYGWRLFMWGQAGVLA